MRAAVMTEFNAPLSVEEVGHGSAEVLRDFPRLIELPATGRLDVAAMVTRRIALDDVNDGLAAIERGEVIRSVIVN